MRKDHALEPPQLRAGLDAELVDEHLAADAHHLERLGLPARPVQRDHQLAAQTLAQRMLGDERLQLAREVLGASARQLRGDSLLDGLHVQLLEASELIEAVVGQDLATPQPQGQLEVGRGTLAIILSEQ